MTLIVSIVVLFCLLLWIQVKTRPFHSTNFSDRIGSGCRKVLAGKKLRPLLSNFEWKKTLAVQKGFFVLLSLLCAVLYVKPPYVLATKEESIKENYYHKFRGFVTDETIQRLEDEIILIRNDSRRDASEREEREIILNCILEEAEEKLNAGYLLPQFAYRSLLCSIDTCAYQNLIGILGLLCLCLLFGGIYSYERQKEILPLLSATLGGRKQLIKEKGRLSFFLTLLAFFILYIIPFLRIMWRYKRLVYPWAGIKNLTWFHTGDDNPIWLWILLIYVARFFILICVTKIVVYLSLLCKRLEQGWIVSIAIFLIPAWIALRFPIISFLSPLKILEGNETFISNGQTFLSIVLWGILAFSLSYRTKRKLRISLLNE
ncbi:MAG: hypothetical protein ACLRZ7_05970 [Lachnospiraceae bacterium]